MCACNVQVMRYAYGGSPLWCSLPAPSTDSSSVPRCPCCHAPRVFELQIMPALVSYVDTATQEVDTASSATEGGRGGEEGSGRARPTVELSSSAFDFGVVTVWCCPNSCAGSAHEVAVVQPPADQA